MSEFQKPLLIKLIILLLRLFPKQTKFNILLKINKSIGVPPMEQLIGTKLFCSLALDLLLLNCHRIDARLGCCLVHNTILENLPLAKLNY